MLFAPGGMITSSCASRTIDFVIKFKRMFSDRSSPGNALLTFLETSAKRMGYTELWLETRIVNHRAVQFYKKNGYIRIENYGPYIGREEAVCFSNPLQD